MPEQPYFEASASSHGTLDQSDGEVPQWCDLTLDVTNLSSNATVRLHLTRPAGEAIIDAMHAKLHPWQAGSIIGLLQSQLDEVVARLMSGSPEPGDKDMARGMARCIAIMLNPYNPNWEQVRDDAVARYNETSQ